VACGERVLVVIRLNATFLLLRPYCENICTSFLHDAESLTTYGSMLWCIQIVYIRPYSLNTTTAFYFATECSDVTVFICLRVCGCNNNFVLYVALTRVGLSVLLRMQCCTKCYGLENNSVKCPCCSTSNLATNRSVVSVFINLHCAGCVCVCILWTSCLSQNLKIKK